MRLETPKDHKPFVQFLMNGLEEISADESVFSVFYKPKPKSARIAYCSFVWYRLRKEEIL